MRWFLVIALALVAVTALVWQQRDNTKVAYVNGLPAYTQLPGREFLLQQDCFILSREGTPAAYPLIANHAQIPALPAEVSDKEIGENHGGYRILATATVGSRFKIISVRREESRSGTTISFEILFHDEAERPYPRLDARLLLDHSPETRGEPPVFLAEVVSPRVKF